MYVRERAAAGGELSLRPVALAPMAGDLGGQTLANFRFGLFFSRRKTTWGL